VVAINVAEMPLAMYEPTIPILRGAFMDARFVLNEFTGLEPGVARHGLFRGEKVFIATRPKSLPHAARPTKMVLSEF